MMYQGALQYIPGNAFALEEQFLAFAVSKILSPGQKS